MDYLPLLEEGLDGELLQVPTREIAFISPKAFRKIRGGLLEYEKRLNIFLRGDILHSEAEHSMNIRVPVILGIPSHLLGLPLGEASGMLRIGQEILRIYGTKTCAYCGSALSDQSYQKFLRSCVTRVSEGMVVFSYGALQGDATTTLKDLIEYASVTRVIYEGRLLRVENLPNKILCLDGSSFSLTPIFPVFDSYTVRSLSESENRDILNTAPIYLWSFPQRESIGQLLGEYRGPKSCMECGQLLSEDPLFVLDGVSQNNLSSRTLEELRKWTRNRSDILSRQFSHLFQVFHHLGFSQWKLNQIAGSLGEQILLDLAIALAVSPDRTIVVCDEIWGIFQPEEASQIRQQLRVWIADQERDIGLVIVTDEEVAEERSAPPLKVARPIDFLSPGKLQGVIGPIGSGKTRLLRELVAVAREKAMYQRVIHASFEERCIPSDKMLAQTIGVYPTIVSLFLSTPLARARGYHANVFDLGKSPHRCSRCFGLGAMGDHGEPCRECQGLRFSSELLELAFGDFIFADVLKASFSLLVDLLYEDDIFDTASLLGPLKLHHLRVGKREDELTHEELSLLRIAQHIPLKVFRETKRPTQFLFDRPFLGLERDQLLLALQLFQNLTDLGHGIVCAENERNFLEKCDTVLTCSPGSLAFLCP